jgi:hypothetical protein
MDGGVSSVQKMALHLSQAEPQQPRQRSARIPRDSGGGYPLDLLTPHNRHEEQFS